LDLPPHHHYNPRTGELTTYDSVKQAILGAGLLGDNVAAHAAASSCSGLVAALVSTPADVVKTRLMAAGRGCGSSGGSGGGGGAAGAAAVVYRGAWDCLVQTVRHEGPLALYKG
jgi:solute carrier family 25 uncoupling protein 27